MSICHPGYAVFVTGQRTDVQKPAFWAAGPRCPNGRKKKVGTSF